MRRFDTAAAAAAAVPATPGDVTIKIATILAHCAPVSRRNASGLESAVIKHVLDHVVNNPTVGRVESAGCTAGLFTFCSGIDCIQTKKLTDTAHRNKYGIA